MVITEMFRSGPYYHGTHVSWDTGNFPTANTVYDIFSKLLFCQQINVVDDSITMTVPKPRAIVNWLKSVSPDQEKTLSKHP